MKTMLNDPSVTTGSKLVVGTSIIPPPASCATCGATDQIHVCLPLVVDLLRQDPGFVAMVAQMVAEQLDARKT